MTKRILVLSLLFLFVLTPVLVIAAELRAGEQPSIGANESFIDDLYIAGGNVTSSGEVAGDLVATGGNVLIDGFILEDLMALGGSITILADVGDDVRVGGGNITIAGSVGGDVVIGGGQIQISGDGVGGDVVLAGGALNLNSPVSGDVKIAAGELFINAPISGNVIFRGDKLTLGKNANVGGDLNYKSPKEAEIEEGAVVNGEIIYENSAGLKDEVDGSKVIANFFPIAILAGFLMKLIGALVFGLLFHRYSVSLVNRALSRPLPELGRGFVSLIIIPVASVVLMITVIGLPLGIFGLVAYAAFLIFSLIMVPVLLGSLVHKWIKNPDTYCVSWKIILLGVVLYSILGFIPLVGWLAKFALILMILGSASKMKWDLAKEWR